MRPAFLALVLVGCAPSEGPGALPEHGRLDSCPPHGNPSLHLQTLDGERLADAAVERVSGLFVVTLTLDGVDFGAPLPVRLRAHADDIVADQTHQIAFSCDLQTGMSEPVPLSFRSLADTDSYQLTVTVTGADDQKTQISRALQVVR